MEADAPPSSESTKTEGEPNKLNITVAGQDGNEIVFQVKTSTKWSKIHNAYCSHRAISPGTMRLFFEGRRVSNDLTIADYQLEEGDQVDAVLQQTGG